MKTFREGAAEKMREAARLIDGAMYWALTTQGQEYWEKVNKNLRQNADEAEKGDSCRGEIEALRTRLAELEKRCCP